MPIRYWYIFKEVLKAVRIVSYILYTICSLLKRYLMSFRPPTFNLLFSGWRVLGAGGAYAAPDVAGSCCLSQGKRVLIAVPPSTPTIGTLGIAEIMVPKLTDIRAAYNGASPDLLEVPTGSKRFYAVQHVDDVGKGYPNEYRLVLASYQGNGATAFTPPIPAPVPLP